MNTQPDPQKLAALMSVAAASLVGETVMIRFHHPIYENFSGQARMDSRGVKTIDLSQDLDGDALLYVFLHEVGHFLLGDVDPEFLTPPEIERAFEEQGPLMRMSEAEQDKYNARPCELQADSFAKELYRIAKYEALERFGDDSIENCLRILSNTTILPPEEKSND